MLLSAVSTADSYLQFITVLVLFVFVLGITYVTTRWIANYQKDKTKGGNIEVLESFRIAPNKYIQIVRTGSRYLAIAVGKDEVHMLTELSKEELVMAGVQENADFGSILEKLRKHKQNEND